MSNGRLMALGCVVALAVMVGVVGAVVVMGGMLTVPLLATSRATPTPAYVESMKPVPGKIASGGVAMTADPDGGGAS